MSPPHFDMETLYLRLDRARRDQRISWREVGRQAGLSDASVSWITRVNHGQSIHVDTLIPLLLWLGDTDLRPYITRG